uniref:COMMD8 helical N-terminal domain-containing protein n=1 Tax=Pavo cristatus TaxID=9049 RepID=A0A8C9FAT7_PAVCR
HTSKGGTPLWTLSNSFMPLSYCFLHNIVDGICGRGYPRYQDYSGVWSLAEWMEVLEETRTYFKTAVGKNVTDEEVRAHHWLGFTLRDHSRMISFVFHLVLKYFCSVKLGYIQVSYRLLQLVHPISLVRNLSSHNLLFLQAVPEFSCIKVFLTGIFLGILLKSQSK